MNGMELMKRTGYDLVCWNPNTEDWVVNRKYIAVLDKEGTHWIESKAGEGIPTIRDIELPNTKLMFSFVHFVGFDFDNDQGMFLVFEKDGRHTGLLIDDCMFYKNEKPPVLKGIENKIKQKLT